MIRYPGQPYEGSDDEANDKMAADDRERQIKKSIKTATFREMRKTPGHIYYGIWINGGKAGELCVREDESESVRLLLKKILVEKEIVPKNRD